MSKRQTLMILGIIVVILPFLGFPGAWLRIIFVVTGFLVATVAYTLRGPVKHSNVSNVPYVEHKNEPPC